MWYVIGILGLLIALLAMDNLKLRSGASRSRPTIPLCEDFAQMKIDFAKYGHKKIVDLLIRECSGLNALSFHESIGANGRVYYMSNGEIKMLGIERFFSLVLPPGEEIQYWVIEAVISTMNEDSRGKLYQLEYSYHLRYGSPWTLASKYRGERLLSEYARCAVLTDEIGHKMTIHFDSDIDMKTAMAQVLSIISVKQSNLRSCHDVFEGALRSFLPALRATKSTQKSPKIASLVQLIEGGTAGLKEDMEFYLPESTSD